MGESEITTRDEEQRRVEEQREREMAAQEAEESRRHGRIAKIVVLGLVLFLVVLLGWKLLGKLPTPATALDATAGPVCDAGTVDSATMMPAFVVPKGAQVVLYLACDGYPAGTNGEVVIQKDGQPPAVIPFALEPVKDSASLFVTDMGTLPVGMYTVEFRTAGRQSRTLATTYTRVVAQ